MQTVIIVLVLVGVLLTAGYFLARFVTNRKLQALLLMLAILPFWTSYLIGSLPGSPCSETAGSSTSSWAKLGCPRWNSSFSTSEP